MEEISGLVFSRGLSAAEWQQVSRKRQLGKYLKLAPGVYVPAGVFAEAPPWERHRLGALAVGASGTHILAGISAAALWGMWVYIVDDAAVEYYVTQGRVKPQEVGRRFRGRLPQGHRITGQRATVTSIPRTIIDLARFHGFEACFMAMTWAFRNNRCTPEDIRSALMPPPLPRLAVARAATRRNPREQRMHRRCTAQLRGKSLQRGEVEPRQCPRRSK